MIAGAILAAGEGSRFGGPKQLAELHGRPLLEHAVAAMTAVAALQRVIVVLGAHAAEIRAAVGLGRAEPVDCPGWREGIAASLRCALDSLPDADPLVIALGDQPGITPEAIQVVLQVALEHPSRQAVRAVYGGLPGHPVVVRPSLLGQLRGLTGDEGARRLLAGSDALEVECAELARHADIDTREQLEELRR